MKKKQSIRTIARRVRRWAERVDERRDGKDPNLGGLCAIASRQLHAELVLAGYEARIAYRQEHCFVLVEDYLVDVTASQFGGPRIVVRQIKRLDPVPWYWQHQRTYKTNRGFNARLKKDRWPRMQMRCD